MDTLLMEEAFTAISRTFDEAANSSSAPLLKGTTSGGMTEAAASASAAAHEASFATQCEVCDADADGCACCADVSVEPKARVPDGSKARVPSWPVRPGFGTVSLRGKMASMVGKSRAAPAALSHRPLIDCHQHCQANDAEGLDNLHQINVACGLIHAVLLALRQPGSDASDVQRRNRWVLDASRRYGSHFIPFVTVIEDDPGAAAMLESAIEQGARGLKLIGWAGTFIKQFDYDLRSEVMERVFCVAEARHVPILAHVWIGCQHAPHRDYVADLDAIMSGHPSLRLILAHYGLGFDAASLPRLSDLLTRHANLYLDTSLYGGARAKWLGRASEHSAALRALVREHPSQICMRGTLPPARPARVTTRSPICTCPRSQSCPVESSVVKNVRASARSNSEATS